MKNRTVCVGVIIFLILALLSIPLEAQEPFAKITLKGCKTFHAGAPVSIPLEGLTDVDFGSVRFEEIRDSESHPVRFQIERGVPLRLWWMLPEDIRDEMTYVLREGYQETSPFVTLHIDEVSLEISAGESGVLRYNYGIVQPPESENPLYARSGFIHPLWTPDGKVLTRIHPSDHIHHLGFWNPWTKTEFEGRSVDFWNLAEGKGTVRFVEFREIKSGPIFASFEAIHEHVDLKAPEGEKVVLNEVWEVRVWNGCGQNRKLWMWDFVTTQRCATDQPLTLLKYRYGGFGFRGTPDWTDRNSDYLTSDGKTRVNGNGTRARWCQAYGKTDEGSAGIVFLSHPKNHEHPEPMRIWPEGDVFFGFCPVVYNDWILEPGHDYVRKYRVIAYDGTMAADEIEKYWQAFANPLEIQIEWLDE
ncbi:MAG: PmoA family protein [bacterium]